MQNIRFFEKKGPFPFSQILKKIDPTIDLPKLKDFKVEGGQGIRKGQE